MLTRQILYPTPTKSTYQKSPPEKELIKSSSACFWSMVGWLVVPWHRHHHHHPPNFAKKPASFCVNSLSLIRAGFFVASPWTFSPQTSTWNLSQRLTAIILIYYGFNLITSSTSETLLPFWTLTPPNKNLRKYRKRLDEINHLFRWDLLSHESWIISSSHHLY